MSSKNPEFEEKHWAFLRIFSRIAHTFPLNFSYPKFYNLNCLNNLSRKIRNRRTIYCGFKILVFNIRGFDLKTLAVRGSRVGVPTGFLSFVRTKGETQSWALFLLPFQCCSVYPEETQYSWFEDYWCVVFIEVADLLPLTSRPNYSP